MQWFDLIQEAFGRTFRRVSSSGKGSYVSPLAKIIGGERIKIGAMTNVHEFARLECCDFFRGPRYLRNTDQRGISLGDWCIVRPHAVLLTWGGHIRMGNHCAINHHCVLMGQGGIEIGDYVRMGPQTTVAAVGHGYDRTDIPIARQATTEKGVVIEDDVWIGVRSVILDGVRVGTGSIIGAGSVVANDVPSKTVVAGVPARVIQERE